MLILTKLNLYILKEEIPISVPKKNYPSSRSLFIDKIIHFLFKTTFLYLNLILGLNYPLNQKFVKDE